MSDDRERLAERFRVQAGWCGRLGSPLYEDLLVRAADDIAAGGPVWRAIEPWAAEPARFTHHLRLMGALHRRALAGEAPELAAHYPSTGGDGDPDRAWRAILALLESDPPGLTRGVQTNEVGRSAALLGGFLTVVAETGLGLRLLELGASAGLNLRFDRFHFRAPDWEWGDRASPASVRADYAGGARPPLPRWTWIAERRGCDADPVDPATEDGRLTLLSFVWPDQGERLRQLDAAIDVARRVPAAVDRADAADWIEARLPEPRGGAATVVYHSVFWGYLDEEGQQRVAAAIEAAGRAASPGAPLAWLRMEPGADQTDLTLTLWPGGAERVLARAGYHGTPVHWLTG